MWHGHRALERRDVTGHEGVQIGVLVQREELARLCTST